MCVSMVQLACFFHHRYKASKSTTYKEDGRFHVFLGLKRRGLVVTVSRMGLSLLQWMCRHIVCHPICQWIHGRFLER
jgi:hypothetical protein